MTAFDRLHPAVQHHVVNSLRWSSLRPLQEAAIGPLLDGKDALLVAPTAGGKTEAAVLPLLSRMLAESWPGLALLYLSPIKALLNNLEIRLRQLFDLLGHRVAVWHGDVGQSERQRIVRDPPSILLTTPESLEVVLVSRRVEHAVVFSGLRAVVVDEIHAFAGDDRGWHLIALLDRIGCLAKGPLQRIGLSATLGNPDQLLAWFSPREGTGRVAVRPDDPDPVEPDVRVDYVGTLDNAATVISRLHRGEKRLVFCDSRSQVESLATALRGCGVATYVSHSSLSADERKRAESAFASARDCVIVATSTLELGIDVGDLDRVIQIDAPYTVAGFLQRLGRTGRRHGSARNCLFLGTSEGGFLRALAIVHLWRRGYVEPIEPPALPYHVLAQQLMALALQEAGVGRTTWREWLARFPFIADITDSDAEAIVGHMVGLGYLHEGDHLLSMGERGEGRFGRRNFLEVFSVFQGSPLFTVLHGRSEIGQVHEMSFVATTDQGPRIISLGGRGWRVVHIDRHHRTAWVEPVASTGRSRWMGGSRPLSFELCQSIKAVLAGAEADRGLSRRAREKLDDLREEHVGLHGAVTALEWSEEESRWWSFAGQRLNAAVAGSLREDEIPARADDLVVRIRARRENDALRASIERALGFLAGGARPAVPEDLSDRLKFAECVPDDLRARTIQHREGVQQEAGSLLRQGIRLVTTAG